MKRVSSVTNILSSSVALGFVLLGARGLAAAKDVIVSRTFGTSSELDAFLVAFGIMMFLASMLSNAGASTLVPALARARNDPDPFAEARLVVVAAGTAVLLGGAVALAAVLFRARLSSWIAPGFSTESAVAVQHLLILLTPVPALATLQGVITSTLNARYGFRGAAAISAITPLCTAASLLLSHHPTVGLLALGTLIGLVTEIVCLCMLARTQKIAIFTSVSWSNARRSVRGLARDFGPLVLGTALSSTSPLVDQAFASTAGPGAVSTLNYANRLTALAMAIGISSIGLIALPHFSDLAARESWREMRTLLHKLSAATFLLGLPATILLVVLSDFLIRLIFQHGHFKAADTMAVSSVQILYALQIPFHLTGIVGVRALNSMRQNRTITLVVVCNVLWNVAADYVFMKLFGLRGIALSTSSTYLLSCLVILGCAEIELRKRAPVLAE
ncbi:MAG: lipid II flippase MurJ [Pseudomonadota bacterium]